MCHFFLRVHLTLNLYFKFVFTGLAVKLNDEPSSSFLFTESLFLPPVVLFVNYYMSNFLFSEFLFCYMCVFDREE